MFGGSGVIIIAGMELSKCIKENQMNQIIIKIFLKWENIRINKSRFIPYPCDAQADDDDDAVDDGGVEVDDFVWRFFVVLPLLRFLQISTTYSDQCQTNPKNHKEIIILYFHELHD